MPQSDTSCWEEGKQTMPCDGFEKEQNIFSYLKH